MQTPHIRIVHKKFQDGERAPLLVDASGIPLYDATVWAMSSFRSMSAETVEQALRGSMLIHLFCWRRRIDLSERMVKGNFFDTGEIEGLVSDAFKLMSELRTRDPLVRNGPLKKRPVSAVSLLRKRPSRSNQHIHVDSETARLRLYYGVRYLRWLGERQKSRFGALGISDPLFSALQHYGTRLNEILAGIDERSPKKKDVVRECLNDTQINRLIEITEPSSPENPWKDEFVKIRNHFIINILRGIGIRKGELLGARVNDVDRRQGTFSVIRRHDDRSDPRKRQPNAKTRERELALDNGLMETAEKYLLARREIHSARKHGFLIVNRNGSPLSPSAITEMFALLREKFPEIGNAAAHILRHQWNDDYSKYADEIGLDGEEEARQRVWMMGWKATSKMPSRYLKRRTRENANRYAREYQGSLMKTAHVNVGKYQHINTGFARRKRLRQRGNHGRWHPSNFSILDPQ